MKYLWIALGVVAGLVLVVLILALECYRRAFYAPPEKTGKVTEDQSACREYLRAFLGGYEAVGNGYACYALRGAGNHLL